MNPVLKIEQNYRNPVRNIFIRNKPVSNKFALDYSIPKTTVNKKLIVIVVDEPRILESLVRVFYPLFNVLTANSGLAGYKIIKEKKPDLVLYDIGIPELTGNELASMLKSSMDTCHIPIIILTEKTSVEQKIKVLESGADDYINITRTDNQLLLAKCASLIRNRTLLLSRLNDVINNSDKSDIRLGDDYSFLKKLNELIYENIDNEKLDIKLICSHIGISYASLFRKTRYLLGITPNDYILRLRMKKAAKILISSKDMRMYEVAEDIGFSVRHFSTLFKKYYGVSPKNYRSQFAG